MYNEVEDVNIQEEKLNKTIGIACSVSRFAQWSELNEFFKGHDINISNNLRRAVYDELDKIQLVYEKHRLKS